MLSIPKIKRLIANTNVKRNAPSNGDAYTIKDTAIDNIPTPIANTLDQRDALLRVTIPYSILAIPIKSKPMAKSRIKNPIANSGNEMTMIPNAIVKPPKIIFPIREDFGRAFNPIPTMTLSIPRTNNVTDKSNTRSVTPALG